MTEKAVRKAADRGRISKQTDGTYDLESSRVAWDQNVDLHRQSRGLKAKAAARGRGKSLSRAKVLDRALAATQLRRESIRVKREELRFAREQGEVIDAKEADRAWKNVALKTRNMFLLLPAKLGAKASHLISDAVLFQNIAVEVVRSLLTEISELPPHANRSMPWPGSSRKSRRRHVMLPCRNIW